MKVTVIDREAMDRAWGRPGPFTVVLRTVEIADTCQVCGEPRGEVRGRNGCENGDYYHVNVWENPCGHQDTYRDVLAEAAMIKEARP